MPDILSFLRTHLGNLRLLLALFGSRFIALLFVCALITTDPMWTIFLKLVNVVESLVLDQLVHAAQSLVVLLQSVCFSLGKAQVFVLQRQKPLQVFDFFVQLLVIRLDFLVEGLLEIKVSLERGDLAIPEVDLILRRSFGLHQDVNLVFKGLVFFHLAGELSLQVVDFLLHDFPVRVKCRPQLHILLRLSFLHDTSHVEGILLLFQKTLALLLLPDSLFLLSCQAVQMSLGLLEHLGCIGQILAQFFVLGL